MRDIRWSGANPKILVKFRTEEEYLNFEKKLYQEGYHTGLGHGIYIGCNWMWISLSEKLFACGMPGVLLGKAYKDHAVTLKEYFIIRKIYEAGTILEESPEVEAIYAKYEGLKQLDMPE